MQEFTIQKNDAGQRLDRFLKKYLSKAPLSRVYTLIRKDCRINGKRCAENYMLQEGDVLSLFLTDAEIADYTAPQGKRNAKRQFSVIYEDENILIVSKPFGLLVHGDGKEKKDTLANQVIAYLIESGAYSPRTERSFTPSPVHRLDRNTTGLVVFGKSAEALRQLSAMFRSRTAVSKYYLTIVSGELKNELRLKDSLEKDEKTNTVSVLSAEEGSGKLIETIARPIAGNEAYTLIEAELVTGRSHQIRVHLKSAGYPLIGDAKYGDRRVNRFAEQNFGLSTQLLHAYRLRFNEAPPGLEYLKGKSFTSPPPPAFSAVELGLFGKEIPHEIER